MIDKTGRNSVDKYAIGEASFYIRRYGNLKLIKSKTCNYVGIPGRPYGAGVLGVGTPSEAARWVSEARATVKEEGKNETVAALNRGTEKRGGGDG